MLSALVAVEGTLGDVVSRVLERGDPPWKTIRSRANAGQERSPVHIVIVDDDVDRARTSSMHDRSSAPLLVLGRDLEKPFSIGALRTRAFALATRPSSDEDAAIVCVDDSMKKALRIADAAAPRDNCVLVTGPTGVGKELVARRIHERSGRAGAFVPINCAALTTSLVESALFGHARGAFTSAFNNVPGAFVEAEHGTLFLDEIGELELAVQAKLLRVLEDGRVRPLGATTSRAVSVRVVAATNRCLREEAEAGRFRLDLYYRLASFVVDIPPLRERLGDMRALIERFAERSGAVFDESARRSLAAHRWPGNVRELRNIVERAATLCADRPISDEDLALIAPEILETPRDSTLAGRERRSIADALRKADGARARAAEELGIHRSTLWRKLNKGTARQR